MTSFDEEISKIIKDHLKIKWMNFILIVSIKYLKNMDFNIWGSKKILNKIFIVN
jgi:hypothetical protein